MEDLLEKLNPVQREAVTHPGGPLLIFAGAGSGKTRVLTHRVAYLIREGGVHPGQILAVTFTNKAANEMKERIAGLVGSSQESIWIGTFHALSARMLRFHGHQIGIQRDFVIYDEQDQEAVIKECFRDLNIDEKRTPPRSVLGAISRAKERLVTPAEYCRTAQGGFERVVSDVYPAYARKLRVNHALDFDDLIVYAVELLRECQPVRDELQSRFRHVLVDEFQDINHSQYAWTRLIGAKHNNVMVVGDDDQSIYSWRGADVRFILAFERDYPDAQVIKLEQNYRSTKNILNAAHAIVSRNRTRADKRLWTDGPVGEEIAVYSAYDEYDEARYVASKIAEGRIRDARRYADFAVLYRMNSQSRALEDELRRSQIPYRVVGGLRFYDRKEVKDLVAYLRLVANPADSVSLRRTLNTPPRGIGAATLARLQQYATDQEISLYDAMRSVGRVPDVSAGIRKKVGDFVALVEEMRVLSATVSVRDLLKAIVSRTGFEQTLEGESSTETETRKGNVQELMNVAAEFAGAAEDHGLGAFLEEMALVSDVDQLREDEDGVPMMTLHSAKGLEFPVVFMVGMEDGVFPHSRSMSDDSALEEERRLCYVGITRAMQEVNLLHAFQRTAWGTRQYNPPSRFLRDIPPECIASSPDSARLTAAPEVPASPAPRRSGASGESTWGWDAGQTSASRGASIDAEAILARHRPPAPKFRAGGKVRHPVFGTGVVLAVEGTGDDAEVKVHFQGAGMKRLALAYAPLEPVSDAPADAEAAPPEAPAPADPFLPDVAPTEALSFARGDRVLHRRFGPGTITAVHGEGPTAEVTVAFGNSVTKRLDPHVAHLEKVPGR